MFAPRRGKRVGLSRKMIRFRDCFSIMNPHSSVTRSAEDKDKRRISCTRCAVPCAGCAMDEAQRKQCDMGRDASQRAVHPFSTPAKSGYTARRRVLGGATGALGALPGGGASGAGRGGRREREAAAARGAQAGQAAKGRRRRSTELRRRAPCPSRRDGPRRRRAEMSEKAQGRDEQGGAGPR